MPDKNKFISTLYIMVTQTLNISFINKIYGLLCSLTHTKEEFEMVADEVEDCNLRTALHGMSLESSIYASELFMQLKTHGIQFPKLPQDLPEGANLMLEEDLSDVPGNELFFICDRNEHFIINGYKNILSESFLFPGLRDIMMYQLHALKSGFMKIKFLNKARFNSLEEQITFY